MAIALPIKSLKSALAAVKPFSNSKNADTCVLIVVGNDACKVRTSSAIGAAVSSFAAGGELEAKVDIQKLSAVLNKINGENVKLSIDGPNLRLSSGRTLVSLPRYESRTFIPVIEEVSGTCEVSKAEWLDRAGKCSWLHDSNETTMIQACRIVAEGGVLNVVASTNHSWAASKLAFSGDEIDTTISHDGMSALKSSLRHVDAETMELLPQESQCTVRCDEEFECTIKGTQGRLPILPSAVTGHMQGAEKWQVEQEDILEILDTTAIFLTECSTGIWLIPDKEGLHVSFTGEADGTLEQDLAVAGRCASMAPGAVSGDKVYMSHKLLHPMIKGADDSKFTMLSMKGRVGVESETYFAVSAAMAEPQQQVQV